MHVQQFTIIRKVYTTNWELRKVTIKDSISIQLTSVSVEHWIKVCVVQVSGVQENFYCDQSTSYNEGNECKI